MVRAIEPNYKDFFAPNVARRMGKILKRAMVTSSDVIKTSGISNPDAIITGTGLGCIENTEKFLSAMTREGEEFLQPTFFMQSTHNTVSSQIAVNLKSNGYNSTHVQDGISFESALLDAYMNFELGKFSTALVGGHDEMTPDYFTLLDKIGYWKKEPSTQQGLVDAITEGSFSGETAVSFMLQNERSNSSLCTLRGVDIVHKPSDEQLKATLHQLLQRANLSVDNIDAVLIGKNGSCSNDAVYRDMSGLLFNGIPKIWYKHIFGESYTATGLGLYVAATCISQKQVPQFLCLNKDEKIDNVDNILLYNHFHNQDHSFILLSSC